MAKKNVALIGATGMLGAGVYRALKDTFALTLIAREKEKLSLLDEKYGGVQKHKQILFDATSLIKDYKQGFQKDGAGEEMQRLSTLIGDVDAVINCIGIIKPHSIKNPEETFFLNSAFPYILSSKYKDKLIQITTDCVFDGLSGAPYTEKAHKNPVDLYGLTKMLGEPTESLVLRTSIIGPELTGHLSLLDWFLSQKEKEVKGFTNHLWNGVTTLEFGNICKKIINNRKLFPKNGVYHVFSTDISKYNMLKHFNEKYKTNHIITPIEASVPIDRRLATTHTVNDKLAIPTFKEMLSEM